MEITITLSSFVRPYAPRLKNSRHFGNDRLKLVKNHFAKNPTKNRLYQEIIEQMLKDKESKRLVKDVDKVKVSNRVLLFA